MAGAFSRCGWRRLSTRIIQLRARSRSRDSIDRRDRRDRRDSGGGSGGSSGGGSGGDSGGDSTVTTSQRTVDTGRELEAALTRAIERAVRAEALAEAEARAAREATVQLQSAHAATRRAEAETAAACASAKAHPHDDASHGPHQASSEEHLTTLQRELDALRGELSDSLGELAIAQTEAKRAAERAAREGKMAIAAEAANYEQRAEIVRLHKLAGLPGEPPIHPHLLSPAVQSRGEAVVPPPPAAAAPAAEESPPAPRGRAPSPSVDRKASASLDGPRHAAAAPAGVAHGASAWDTPACARVRPLAEAAGGGAVADDAREGDGGELARGGRKAASDVGPSITPQSDAGAEHVVREWARGSARACKGRGEAASNAAEERSVTTADLPVGAATGATSGPSTTRGGIGRVRELFPDGDEDGACRVGQPKAKAPLPARPLPLHASGAASAPGTPSGAARLQALLEEREAEVTSYRRDAEERQVLWASARQTMADEWESERSALIAERDALRAREAELQTSRKRETEAAGAGKAKSAEIERLTGEVRRASASNPRTQGGCGRPSPADPFTRPPVCLPTPCLARSVVR